MRRLLALVFLLVSVAGCKGTPAGPSTTCCFTQTGTGDTVFTVPDNVKTAKITGTYTGSSSNFILWIGPQGSACSSGINAGCRLIVNEIIGTFGGNSTNYTGTLQTGGGGLAQITHSAGVAWTFTQVP